jgi:hypothetical protein
VYIEFDILDVDVDFDTLEYQVREWARIHHVPFTTKVARGLKYRLGLNYPEHFTLFFMTWAGCDYRVRNAGKS